MLQKYSLPNKNGNEEHKRFIIPLSVYRTCLFCLFIVFYVLPSSDITDAWQKIAQLYDATTLSEELWPLRH